ncbi:hypothetical protein ADIS_3004 [Lunatimonas lonarensis]|uniref:Tetracyclin repressor-like C-terminal domain-containing protein n=1 Tax=Lunatimonas lonarensis TaxID=1232681 RepID=R7ZRB8_9BACT|nr:TetR family transcriptional regulator C-terminal domain-containing protein [Lunatimonas lonarensis]EON76554.1 hypothetical protein ADIS_3004 [Lunatimonas lonarensis]
MTEAKKNSGDKKQLILEEYISYILENGKEPSSVFKFAKGLKMKEGEFYQFFTSFEAIKESVWEILFDKTIKELQSQEVYPGYSSREKLLGFFYTWLEELKGKRSYLLSVYSGRMKERNPFMTEMKSFKEKFKSFARDIVLEGKETDEIADRPFITDRYDEALWLQVMFVFQFWMRDTSPAFEKTDAAVEKSVNLAFDLMGKSAVDSFVDFAKFLYQSK